MGVLRKLCYGQYSLPIAFWLFFVGGTVIGTVAIMILANFTILDATKQHQPFLAIYAIGVLIFYSYIATVAVGVWNSAAPRTKSAIWMERIPAFLSRLVVFFYVAKLIWRTTNGGALNLFNLIVR